MKQIRYKYTYILCLLSLPPPTPTMSSQSTNLSSLCYAAASHEPSVLYMAVYRYGLPWWLRWQFGKPGCDPWVGKIPWRKAWQPTAVFFPGESHAQRSLVGYSPWGRKEADMTERLSTEAHSVYISMSLSQFTLPSPSPSPCHNLYNNKPSSS